MYPLKLLYAERLFGWTALEMGNYLSITGAVRATLLLLLIPLITKLFRPPRIQASKLWDRPKEYNPAAIIDLNGVEWVD